MVKVIIIEDEEAASNNLIELLQNHYSNFEILGIAKSVSEGVSLIENKNPDIIFLDIQINEGTGFDILDNLKEHKSWEIIFTTGLMDFKEKAMDYFAFYYLNKPLEEEKFKKVINRFLDKRSAFNEKNYQYFKNQINANKKSIALTVNNEYEIVDTKDILYCEAQGNYTIFHTIKKQYVNAKILKSVEEMLDTQTFFRIHRSTLVNINNIKKIDKSGLITLSNNETIQVSARNKSGFIKRLKINNIKLVNL